MIELNQNLRFHMGRIINILLAALRTGAILNPDILFIENEIKKIKEEMDEESEVKTIL